VLSDPTQSERFLNSRHWNTPLLNFQLRIRQDSSVNGGGGPAWRSNSFSGNERNRFLLSTASGFVDRSLVSGVDCREDARSFATLDYDGDGWLDLALASVGAPRLRLFRNRMAGMGEAGRVLRLDLVGGPGSNRDAVGALVKISTSRGERVYRRSLGEGLSAQNAGGVRITLRKEEVLDSLRIRWPSGAETTVKPLPAGSRVRIKE